MRIDRNSADALLDDFSFEELLEYCDVPVEEVLEYLLTTGYLVLPPFIEDRYEPRNEREASEETYEEYDC